MTLPSGFQEFLETADNIWVKTNQWIMNQIKSYGYSIEFMNVFHVPERGITHHVWKAVLICEFSWEISYRNRFTMAHELGHIIFALKHQKIALDFDLIRKKKEEWFTISQEEKKILDEIEERCNEFAGRLLVSRKFAPDIWKKAKEICRGVDDYLPFFASYFCVSEECAEIVHFSYAQGWHLGNSKKIISDQ